MRKRISSIWGAGGLFGDEKTVFMGKCHFIGEVRAWQAMSGCSGGFSYSSLTGTLYGARKTGNTAMLVRFADGGREVTWLRVNICTKELFVGTCCRGMWKIAPPKE